MTGEFNAPYRRRFPDPEQWPSNRSSFSDQPQRAVNELSWWLAGEQVAEEADAFLRLMDRQRAARAEGWHGGSDPGE